MLLCAYAYHSIIHHMHTLARGESQETKIIYSCTHIHVHVDRQERDMEREESSLIVQFGYDIH